MASRTRGGLSGEYFHGMGTIDIPTKDCISWIFDEPDYDIDKPIYVDASNPSRSVSGRESRTIVRRLTAGLRAAGLKKGDVACLHAFNDIYYSLFVLGTVGAGGIFAGTNPAYTPAELVHHIKTAKAQILVTELELLDAMLVAAQECGIPKSKIFIFNIHGQPCPPKFKPWTWLLEHGEEDWVRFNDLETSKNTTCCRLFSSGTTGFPKAAELSHYNLVAQHTMTVEALPKPYEIRRLLPLPMFHAAAVPMAHFSTLKSGSTSYIMRRFGLEAFLDALEKYQITDLVCVPPIVIAVVMSPLNKKYSLKSVKTATCGAAPLDKGSQGRLQRLLSPNASFTQLWGMTETSCIGTMFPYPESDDTGSIGYLLPNMEGKLVNDDGKNISAYNKEGELCVRGPTIIQGYFADPAANAVSFDNEGFYHTGDIAYCDEKTKKWYIVDRKKELIKVRGFQVAPPELEAVILSHPHIIDAAVIGVQASVTESELPRAYVVRRPTPEGSALTEEAVKEYAGQRLARFKRLDGGVVFMDTIPKNASGKVLKRILREQAKMEDAFRSGEGKARL